MWNRPTEKELAQLPRIYETDSIPAAEKVIRMHFFLGQSDWYIAEYDPTERIFFGFAILNDDLLNAEWGYIALEELADVRVPPGLEVDRDLYWRPKPAIDVSRIVEAYERRGQSLR